MTKLEELKAARDAAWVDYAAARDASIDARDASIDAADGILAYRASIYALDTWAAAWAAYEAELDKIKEENPND
jgi:hypothetical protein